MRTILVGLWALFCLLIASCDKDTSFKTLPEGPINHHLIVLAKQNDKVVARGFSAATPPNTEVYCEVGKTSRKVNSNADGSFFFELTGVDTELAAGEFTFSVGGKIFQQGYQIKDLPQCLKKITKEAFKSDREVSAISFLKDDVAILSSAASVVRMFGIDNYFRPTENPTSSVLLNKDAKTPAYPSMVQSVGNHLVVSLSEIHELALIDPKVDAIAARARVEDDQGKLFRFTIAPPLQVKNALDADESGTATTTISQSSARNPEAIIALDDTHFLASFANYYQYEDDSQGQKSVVGPGVIALFAIENGTLKTKAREVLDFKNPRYFVAKDAEHVWVVAQGAWSNIGKANVTSSDAGLVRLKIATDKSGFSVEHRIPLNDFTPTIPVLYGGKIILPRYDKSELAIIDENATSVTDADKKKPKFHRDFGFTFAALWHDDIVFLGDKLGTVVAYSVKDGDFPFPFVEPIIIDKNLDERIGLRSQMLYFRHTALKKDIKVHAPIGFNAWLVSDTHQKIYPMDFLEVFGP